MTVALQYHDTFKSQPPPDDEDNYVTTHEIRVHSNRAGNSFDTEACVYIQMFQDRTKPGTPIGEIYQIAVPLNKVEELAYAILYAKYIAENGEKS